MNATDAVVTILWLGVYCGFAVGIGVLLLFLTWKTRFLKNITNIFVDGE